MVVYRLSELACDHEALGSILAISNYFSGEPIVLTIAIVKKQ